MASAMVDASWALAGEKLMAGEMQWEMDRTSR